MNCINSCFWRQHYKHFGKPQSKMLWWGSHTHVVFAWDEWKYFVVNSGTTSGQNLTLYAFPPNCSILALNLHRIRQLKMWQLQSQLMIVVFTAQRPVYASSWLFLIPTVILQMCEIFRLKLKSKLSWEIFFFLQFFPSYMFTLDKYFIYWFIVLQ